MTEPEECPKCGAPKNADRFDKLVHAGLGIKLGYACADCETVFTDATFSSDRRYHLSDGQTRLDRNH